MAACGKATMVGLGSLVVNRVLEANFSPMMLTAPKVWERSMAQRYAIAFITGALSLPLSVVVAVQPASVHTVLATEQHNTNQCYSDVADLYITTCQYTQY
jgi:hypothetical protein